MMLFKRCPDCGIEKPISDFSRNAARPDGLQFYCKICYSSRSARTYRARQRRNGKTVRERVDVPPGYKHCRSCGRTLPHSEWHRVRTTRDGYATACKDCRKSRGRRDYLMRTFGLTEEGLARMIKSQGGVCAICRDGKPEHIDHDHQTGKVRGVLCGPCNMGLGLFKDDESRLHAARRYLRTSRVGSVQMFDHRDPGLVIEVDRTRFHAA